MANKWWWWWWTLTLTSHFGQKVGLAEGRVGSFPESELIRHRHLTNRTEWIRNTRSWVVWENDNMNFRPIVNKSTQFGCIQSLCSIWGVSPGCIGQRNIYFLSAPSPLRMANFCHGGSDLSFKETDKDPSNIFSKVPTKKLKPLGFHSSKGVDKTSRVLIFARCKRNEICHLSPRVVFPLANRAILVNYQRKSFEFPPPPPPPKKKETGIHRGC